MKTSKVIVAKSRVICLALLLDLFSPATFAFEWKQESPSSQTSVVSPSEALQQQITQIDLEILVLKAELALQNGDLKGLQHYLNELNGLDLPPVFAERVQQLQQQADAGKPNTVLRFLGFEPAFTFPMNDPRAVVAVVLPMTRCVIYLKASIPLSPRAKGQA